VSGDWLSGAGNLVGRGSRAIAGMTGGLDDLVVCALLCLQAAEPLAQRAAIKVRSLPEDYLKQSQPEARSSSAPRPAPVHRSQSILSAPFRPP
jgi:hypothetical protein